MFDIRRILASIPTSKGKSFLAVCFCILGGTVLGEVLPDIPVAWWLSGLLFAGVASVIMRSRELRFVFVLFLAGCLGVINYQSALQVPALSDERETLRATVVTEPDVRIDGVRYIVEHRALGRLYVNAPLHPQHQYGDVLSLTCTLRRPGEIEGFRFDMYLATKRVFVMCVRPEIERIGVGEGNIVYAAILDIKGTLADHINQIWHEPYAGFVGGLLYGYRGGLGSLDEAFARTGLTHIVAISGYNIAIIATVLMMIAVRLWLRRQQAFYVVITGIVLFVIFTGASASVVRAGIMGSLVLIATQLGRVGSAGRLAVLAATLMVLVNPFVLLWDVGFQLSFVATLGIIYLVEPISARLRFLRYHWLIETVAATSAAIIVTTPLSLYHFESFSLVALFANVLVLPIIPYIMMSSFAVAILSLFAPGVAVFAGGVPLILMQIVIYIVRLLSALPFAAVQVSIPLGAVIGYYALLCYAYYRYRPRIDNYRIG